MNFSRQICHVSNCLWVHANLPSEKVSLWEHLADITMEMKNHPRIMQKIIDEVFISFFFPTQWYYRGHLMYWSTCIEQWMHQRQHFLIIPQFRSKFIFFVTKNQWLHCRKAQACPLHYRWRTSRWCQNIFYWLKLFSSPVQVIPRCIQEVKNTRQVVKNDNYSFGHLSVIQMLEYLLF